MDGVTSMSFVGTLMALTHSIPINLFVKLEFNNFTPTSSTKYCSCHKYFLAYVCEVLWVLERFIFCPSTWRKAAGRSKVVFRSLCKQEFLGLEKRCYYAKEQ